MKAFIITIIISLTSIAVYACPVCDKQQPKLLQGISHGTGPQGNWDYIIVGATAVIVLITLFYSIKFTVKPREANENHIKRTVLN
jgi:hypothetical protein